MKILLISICAGALALSAESLKTSNEEHKFFFDCKDDAGCDSESAIASYGFHTMKCKHMYFKDCIWGTCYCTFCMDKYEDCKKAQKRNGV